MDLNTILWIVQILLGLAFLGAAYGHTLGYARSVVRSGMTWMAAVGRQRMAIIGSLEILGAVGLVLPAATKILPWLTPVAATCFMVLMVFALIFHARRTGEVPNIVFNVILGALAASVAYGRFVLEPIAPR